MAVKGGGHVRSLYALVQVDMSPQLENFIKTLFRISGFKCHSARDALYSVAMCSQARGRLRFSRY